MAVKVVLLSKEGGQVYKATSTPARLGWEGQEAGGSSPTLKEG